MDKLRAMSLFVRLAELGSFTAVADEKNISKSTISKEVGKLEENIGARLLHRSTRQLQLTPLGEGYLKRCKNILSAVEEANSFVQDLQKQPKGKLRINAPMALGITDLSVMFSDFMKAYPDIELEINLSDEVVDLIERGFDVGFRAASTSFDSNYVGRPLVQFNYKIITSQNYINQHPTITQPSDLEQHQCFIYSYFRNKNIWPLENGVSVSGPLKVNSTIFMMELLKEGLGIGFIPDFVCRKALELGEVIEILPDVSRPNLTLYAMYPARHYMPSNLRHCIDFMEDWFKNKNHNFN